MKASAFEFRIRYLLHLVIYGLGFTAPWNRWLHLDPPGPNAHVWGILAVTMAKAGIGTIGSAFDVLLGLGIAFALVGAGLRTWGAAYLSTDVVKDGSMHTGESGVIADGPYRYLRNPLYLGTFVHTFALALLMPVSGAIFTIVMIGLLQARLILAEEAFLAEKLGPAYEAYCQLVPRVWPTLKARVMGSDKRPRWAQAFVGEIYMWGVAASFVAVGWRYNAALLWQGVIVSVGVSLVARALLPKRASERS